MCSFSSLELIYLFSYFDCEVSPEWTRDSQDLLIWKFLEVQGGVLQVVLPWSIQVQLTFYPLQGLTLHVWRTNRAEKLKQNGQIRQDNRFKQWDFSSSRMSFICRRDSLSPHVDPGLTKPCLIQMFKQKQHSNTGTSSTQQQSSSADRWLQFKCPRPKRTQEIFNEKICPFRKRRAFGPTQEAICKLTMEQSKGKEMEHLLMIWSSGEFDASTLTLVIFAGSLRSPQSQSREQR